MVVKRVVKLDENPRKPPVPSQGLLVKRKSCEQKSIFDPMGCYVLLLVAAIADIISYQLQIRYHSTSTSGVVGGVHHCRALLGPKPSVVG